MCMCMCICVYVRIQNGVHVYFNNLLQGTKEWRTEIQRIIFERNNTLLQLSFLVLNFYRASIIRIKIMVHAVQILEFFRWSTLFLCQRRSFTSNEFTHFSFSFSNLSYKGSYPNFPLIEISMIDSLDNRDSTVLVKQNQISFLSSLVYFLKNSKELSNVKSNYCSSYVNAMILHF